MPSGIASYTTSGPGGSQRPTIIPSRPQRHNRCACRRPAASRRKAKKTVCISRLSLLLSSLSGAIAQMGERLHGMQEVVGSNPIGSILTSPCHLRVCEKSFLCHSPRQMLCYTFDYTYGSIFEVDIMRLSSGGRTASRRSDSA